MAVDKVTRNTLLWFYGVLIGLVCILHYGQEYWRTRSAKKKMDETLLRIESVSRLLEAKVALDQTTDPGQYLSQESRVKTLLFITAIPEDLRASFLATRLSNVNAVLGMRKILTNAIFTNAYPPLNFDVSALR